MMVKMTRTFLRCLFAFLFMLEGHACTMVLVSGNATADGRPLMFKNRDSDDSLGVEMRIVEPRGFTYLGQFTKSTGPWGGYNEKGFAVANTLAYNVPAQAATQNRWVRRRLRGDAGFDDGDGNADGEGQLRCHGCTRECCLL